MTSQQALDKIDKEFGLYNQLEVVHADKEGAIFAPKQDSLYGQTDIDFLESKYKELIGGSDA